MLDLFSYLSIFVEFPLLAAVPAVIFYIMYRANRRRLIVITSALWALYMVWELSIRLGFTCPEGCNIRVDLIVLFPILLLMSALATIFYFVRRD